MSGITESSYRIYERLAARIVPGHKHSQNVYHERLLQLLPADAAWLDLGCGHQILPPWVHADEPGIVARCRLAAGIDLDLPGLRANRTIPFRVMGTLETLPFANASFDLVTANMVVEHLAVPDAVLREVNRVLRPGGRFLLHTPNRKAPSIRAAALTPDGLKKAIVRILEGRRAEDVFPTCYRMNTAGDIQALAAQAGLRVERLDQLSSVCVTAVLGPLAVPELLFLRILRAERFRGLRSNILAVLRKEPQ